MQNLKDIEVQNTFSSQVTESENQDLLDYNLSLSFEERVHSGDMGNSLFRRHR